MSRKMVNPVPPASLGVSCLIETESQVAPAHTLRTTWPGSPRLRRSYMSPEM
jgi:hypothetical protein